jgi:hypothetical protein
MSLQFLVSNSLYLSTYIILFWSYLYQFFHFLQVIYVISWHAILSVQNNEGERKTIKSNRGSLTSTCGEFGVIHEKECHETE